jgi:hypothetical protein
MIGSVVSGVPAPVEPGCAVVDGERRTGPAGDAAGTRPFGRLRRRCADREAEPGDATSPALPKQDFSRLLGRLAPGEDPAHVEAWLRVAHGELEDIDALYFVREVKLAVERIHARGAAGSDELARSFGLRPRADAGARGPHDRTAPPRGRAAPPAAVLAS